jgi:hypothetical protein
MWPAGEKAKAGATDPRLAKMSTRDAAAELGVSHVSVHNARKAIVKDLTIDT